jgi:hypothetical protein
MRIKDRLTCVVLALSVCGLSASTAMAVRPGVAAFRARMAAFPRLPIAPPVGVHVVAPIPAFAPVPPGFFVRPPFPPMAGGFGFGFPMPSRASVSVQYVSPVPGMHYGSRIVIESPTPAVRLVPGPEYIIKEQVIEPQPANPTTDQLNLDPLLEPQPAAPATDAPAEIVPAPEALPLPGKTVPSSSVKPKNAPTPAVRPKEA